MLEIRKLVRGGQITLPKIFREKYQLDEGSLVEIEEKNGCLILRPIKAINKKDAGKLLKNLLQQTKDQMPNMTEDELLEYLHDERKKVRKKYKVCKS